MIIVLLFHISLSQYLRNLISSYKFSTLLLLSIVGIDNDSKIYIYHGYHFKRCCLYILFANYEKPLYFV